jgi:[ribosomal protein S18]-alanine N-acetyltransferase
MPFLIEPASTADFLKVAALDRAAWPDVPDTFIPDGEHVWRVWSEHATLLVARSEGNPATCDSGDITGALVMFPTSAGELFLHKIMVHPDCRGRGIGSALMREALRRATRSVLLTVDPANGPAVQLYRNFGFEVRERVDGYYRPHEDRFVMVHPGSAGR